MLSCHGCPLVLQWLSGLLKQSELLARPMAPRKVVRVLPIGTVMPFRLVVGMSLHRLWKSYIVRRGFLSWSTRSAEVSWAAESSAVFNPSASVASAIKEEGFLLHGVSFWELTWRAKDFLFESRGSCVSHSWSCISICWNHGSGSSIMHGPKVAWVWDWPELENATLSGGLCSSRGVDSVHEHCSCGCGDWVVIIGYCNRGVAGLLLRSSKGCSSLLPRANDSRLFSTRLLTRGLGALLWIESAKGLKFSARVTCPECQTSHISLNT